MALVVFLSAKAQPAKTDAPAKPAAKAKAPSPAGPVTELQIIERVNRSTDKALDYLEQKQIKDGPNDGAWSAGNMAVNALAVLAYLSRGHVPGRGKYGDTMEKNVVKEGVLTRGRRFIVSKAHPNGLLSMAGGHGSMYEHGLTTLALAELYGMSPDPGLEKALRKAVDLILQAQRVRKDAHNTGGWRYTPTSTDSDLSVSVMQIVALRAANNAEIPVPKQAVDDAVAYVRRCGYPTGGYGYTGPGAGPQTSAAGTLSLQLLGKQDDKGVANTLTYMASLPVVWGTTPPAAGYFYYFHYYAIQAFYQGGGKHWNEWHPKVRELLLEHQNSDGSWDVPPGGSEAGIDPVNKVYSTAMATLIMNIYQHYLPAYQR
jgi:hypothetical protein